MTATISSTMRKLDSESSENGHEAASHRLQEHECTSYFLGKYFIFSILDKGMLLLLCRILNKMYIYI